MDHVAERVRGGSDGAKPLPALATSMLLCLSGLTAAAADDQYATVSSLGTNSPSALTRAQVEVSAKSFPRFDNVDGITRSSRVDMMWLPPRRSALGVALGLTNFSQPANTQADRFAGPSLDLGFHWRYTLESQRRIDVTAWHRMSSVDAVDLVQSREPTYGARVEMNLGSTPKTGFVADNGFLGFQLEGGARITMRRSGGKPMLYYRAKF